MLSMILHLSVGQVSSQRYHHLWAQGQAKITFISTGTINIKLCQSKYVSNTFNLVSWIKVDGVSNFRMLSKLQLSFFFLHYILYFNLFLQCALLFVKTMTHQQLYSSWFQSLLLFHSPFLRAIYTHAHWIGRNQSLSQCHTAEKKREKLKSHFYLDKPITHIIMINK